MLSKWEGPYQIMEKLPPLTYAVSKKNQYYIQTCWVHGIAVVEDDGLDSLPGIKLVRDLNSLSNDDMKQIEIVLKEFPSVLTDGPGLTNIVNMNSAIWRSR